MESNKDELKDLEMAKKRNHKIMITDDAIKKVRRIKYEYIDESEYDIIHELVKRVLQIAKNENDSNEVAITYCMNGLEHIQNGEEYVGVALGTEHDVVEAVNLLNEAIDLNNKSKKLKDLQKAADYFLKNSYKVGIKYDDH